MIRQSSVADVLRILLGHCEPRHRAEDMWRVVLKSAGEGDLPVGAAASIILSTAPRDHVEILRRLCEDPDRSVASGAEELTQCLALLLGLETKANAEQTAVQSALGKAEKSPAAKRP